MERIGVLVAEDEARQRARLVRLVNDLPDFEVIGESPNGQEALQAIHDLKPELVLLDVQMPEMNGLEVLEALQPEDVPAVIFVTAYDQYALRAFELHAIDYLLKPFDDDRFEAVLDRARIRIRQGQVEVLGRKLLDLLHHLQIEPGQTGAIAPAQPVSYLERLGIKVGGRMILLKVEDIDWISGAGVYVEVHAGPKRYNLRQTLTHLEERLNPDRFVRIHRSTILNIDRVKELVPHLHGEYMVLLQDGTRLKLSRSYRDKLEVILGSLG